jgi:hypothetical protein
MRNFRRQLQVEELEPRSLLAAGLLVVPRAAEALVAPRHRHQAPALTGTLRGSYAARQARSGATEGLVLTGSGAVGGLGPVSVSGSVRLGRLVLTGVAGGRVTLANARGTVTLRLEAATPGGVVPMPGPFAFRIVRGTGAYRHLAGKGAITFHVGSAGRFALTIQPGNEPASPPQTPPPPGLTSGVRGVVVEWPITPVERPGVPDTRPVPGAIVSVQPAGGGAEIMRQTADAAGMFQIALPPGSYRLVPLPPDPGQIFPRGIPQDIVVGPGQVLDLTLTMDTGIR